MAKKDMYVNLDKNQNKLLNVVLETLENHPENPVKGQLYYNTKEKANYVFTGEKWISLNSIDIISNTGK